MAKKYSVYSKYRNDNKADISGFVLIQSDDLEEAKKGQVAAEFPINPAYDKHTQEQRAEKFAEYLNKIVEMTNELEKSQGV